MFSKKVSKNCYFCINEPLFILAGLMALTPFHIKCKHEHSKHKFTLKNAIFYKLFPFCISLMMFILCICGLYELIAMERGTFYYYSRSFMNTSLGYVCFGNTIIYLFKIKYRREQLQGIGELLQNGKLYNVSTLISYESMKKLRREGQFYYIKTCLVGSMFFGYFTYMSSSVNELLQRYSLFFGMVSGTIFSHVHVLEIKTYREILKCCYKKLQMVLENQINCHENVSENTNINLKYLTLQEQLINIRKLHLAILDNVKLYYNYLSPIITYNIPFFIAWTIFILYATLNMIYRENVWEIDKEYCIMLIITDATIVNLNKNLYFIEKLKESVSFLM